MAFIYASEKFAHSVSKLFHFIYIHIYSMLPKKPWKYIYKLLWVFFTTKSNKANKIEKTAVVDLSKPFPFSFQAINQLFFILARLYLKVNLEIIESATPNHQEKKRPRLHGEETWICCDVVRLLLRSTKTFSFFLLILRTVRVFGPIILLIPTLLSFYL